MTRGQKLCTNIQLDGDIMKVMCKHGLLKCKRVEGEMANERGGDLLAREREIFQIIRMPSVRIPSVEDFYEEG